MEEEPGRFLDPGVLEDPSWQSSFDHGDAYGSGPNVSPSDFNESLLLEWTGHFRGKVEKEDWSRTLFDLPLPQLDSAILFLKGRQAAPPASLVGSSVLAAPDRSRMIAALYYVGFARRIENWMDTRTIWQDQAEEDVDSAEYEAQAEELFQGGFRAFQAAKDPFLRQRYLFQLVRIRFYSGAWDSCAALADRYRKNLSSPSTDLHWRTRCYVAGALSRAGRAAASNLEWAQIYRLGGSRFRGYAFNAFGPDHQSDWEESLYQADGAQQKIALWMLMGLNTGSVEALEKILELDSSYAGLPHLLVYVLRTWESDIWDSQRSDRDWVIYGKVIGSPDPLEEIVARVVHSGRVANPRLWKIGAAMLAAYRGDTARTNGLSRLLLAATPQDSLVDDQMRLFRIQALLNARDGVPDVQERALFLQELRGFYRTARHDRGSDVEGWARGRFARRYATDSTRRMYAALLWGESEPPTEPRYAPDGLDWEDTSTLAKAIDHLRRPRDDFDQWAFSDLSCDVDCQLRRIALIKIRQNRFHDAARTVGLPGFSHYEPTSSSPSLDFLTAPWDSLDVEEIAGLDRPDTLNLVTLARRLDALEKASSAKGDAGAKAMYAIGVLLLHLEGSSMETVMDWLSRANSRARSPELKARIAFAGAEAELRQFYDRGGSSVIGESPSVVHAHRWFGILRREAWQTEYYQEVLRECGYFRLWLRTQEQQCKRG